MFSAIITVINSIQQANVINYRKWFMTTKALKLMKCQMAKNGKKKSIICMHIVAEENPMHGIYYLFIC